jgi:hypothetical protein
MSQCAVLFTRTTDRSHTGLAAAFGTSVVLGVLGFGAMKALASGQGFEPGYQPLFSGAAVHHPIDDTCIQRGAPRAHTLLRGRRTTPRTTFCVTGTLVTLTFKDFDDLQRTAKDRQVRFESPHTLPPDRVVLTDFMEGSAGVTIGPARCSDSHHTRRNANAEYFDGQANTKYDGSYDGRHYTSYHRE